MTKLEVKQVQRTLNAFTGKYLKGVKALLVDGDKGEVTNRRIMTVKYYLGYGKDRDSSWHSLTVRRIRHPHSRKYSKVRMLATGAGRRKAQRVAWANAQKPKDDGQWAGSRHFTNIAVAEGAKLGIGVSRRKWSGPPINGNFGSDHNVWNTTADAVDLPTFSGERLARNIANRLGATYVSGGWNNSHVQYNGRTYRIQILWNAPDGSHRDHVHVGARRL